MKTFHLPVLAVIALASAPLFAQAPPATKTPQQGETWTRELAEPVQRGKLQDAFQFVRGDTGKWSDAPKLLCATLTDKPSKTSLDDWFDQMERRRNAPPRADEDAWLLFRTRQFDDNDRIWIERIERRGKRISVVMNEAIWQGKYFKTFTFYQTYGINLGKLAPGEYSVDWTIRSRTFRQFAGEGKPTPENWPKDDEPAEKKPDVISTTISVAGEPPKVGAASERRESATELGRVDQLWAADGPGGTPSFVKHVVPLFNKVGCSNRSCHGSFQGQGGFRLPHLGEIADEITLIRSMHVPINNHIQAVRALQTGDSTGTNSGRASLGSWVAYALGSESRDLPAFVALTDTPDTPGVTQTAAEFPVGGAENWSGGFLPSVFQGTVVRYKEPRIANLTPMAHLRGAPQESALALLERMNRRHQARRPHNEDLAARTASFQLAARMQLAAADALDFSQETAATRRMYGLDDPLLSVFAANCLLARRLVERGVRFVQVYTRSQFWDQHVRLIPELPVACRRTDQPSAALVKDLKQRGLLDTTIVHWGGEMGRTPVIQGNFSNQAGLGRDHNTQGFSMWLAGGGIKRGYVHGATDEFGHKAVEAPVSHGDYHATLLHLLGLDPAKLAYRTGGRDHSLSDSQQSGRVVREILEDSIA